MPEPNSTPTVNVIDTALRSPSTTLKCVVLDAAASSSPGERGARGAATRSGPRALAPHPSRVAQAPEGAVASSAHGSPAVTVPAASSAAMAGARFAANAGLVTPRAGTA